MPAHFSLIPNRIAVTLLGDTLSSSKLVTVVLPDGEPPFVILTPSPFQFMRRVQAWSSCTCAACCGTVRRRAAALSHSVRYSTKPPLSHSRLRRATPPSSPPPFFSYPAPYLPLVVLQPAFAELIALALRLSSLSVLTTLSALSALALPAAASWLSE